jgi:hypothetical protein
LSRLDADLGRYTELEHARLSRLRLRLGSHRASASPPPP